MSLPGRASPAVRPEVHCQRGPRAHGSCSGLSRTLFSCLLWNCVCSLVVAMETAIEDGRFEEASRLRDEFKALRKAQQLSSSEISDLS